MIDFMKELGSKVKRPDAIIVVSAHWEESVPTLLSSEKPKMLYDYYGFPEETYSVNYPAPGAVDLVNKAKSLLDSAGIECSLDGERGIDHGLFIPLMMSFPEADIPVTQISLVRGLDPAKHIELGKALRALLEENVLIIGSGFSFHNMREFQFGVVKGSDTKNDTFQDWLIDSCVKSSYEEMIEKLIGWEKAPNGRYCHPREEHLLPLHVCAGISDKTPELIFDDQILAKRAVAFFWS
jgi:aromatic ring-opening dioxygenase catalytic subunit (LigB family)